MSISVGDKVYNHETNESLEIVRLVGDIRDTHYKLSDDSVISIIDFITKPIYLIKGDEWVEWKRLKNVVPHPVIKNKNLKSVYVTKDNVKEVQKELGFFEIFNEEVLLTGFLSFQRIPIYIIWINPKSHKTPRYYFANEHEIERYFEFLEDE